MIDEDSPRGRILAAAARVFAAEGYAGTKVDQIARLAGVNKAALYYHVGGKDALYETTLIENVRSVAEVLEASLQGVTDPALMLEVIVRALAASFEKSALVPRIMAQELARGGERLSGPVMLEFMRVLACTRRAILAGVESGVFKGINPILAHLNIVGTLAFAELSRKARSKARDLGAMGNEDWNFTTDDVVARILDSYGLKPKRG